MKDLIYVTKSDIIILIRYQWKYHIGGLQQQRAQFSDAVENDLDSLYSVDLVFVSEHTDAALLTMPNIQQTKITEILNNIAMSCRMEGLEK